MVAEAAARPSRLKGTGHQRGQFGVYPRTQALGLDDSRLRSEAQDDEQRVLFAFEVGLPREPAIYRRFVAGTSC